MSDSIKTKKSTPRAGKKSKRAEKEDRRRKKPSTIEPLSHCTTAPHAEMARSTNDDEPCDDGRGQGAES